MFPFALKPGQISITTLDRVPGGAILKCQDRWLIAAKVDEDGHVAHRAVLLDHEQDMLFPVLRYDVGECVLIDLPDGVEIKLTARPEVSVPRVREYLGSIVITTDGPFLIASSGGTHRWDVAPVLVSLKDGSMRAADSVREEKPIFVQWQLGVSVAGEWHCLVDRSAAPVVYARR